MLLDFTFTTFTKALLIKFEKLGKMFVIMLQNTSHITQQTSTCSHSTIETAEKAVKYVQS